MKKREQKVDVYWLRARDEMRRFDVCNRLSTLHLIVDLNATTMKIELNLL